tara:strand:+ start:4604 stop:4942 length:339 start_codon:yes stop_codon:yes gene_type:complete
MTLRQINGATKMESTTTAILYTTPTNQTTYVASLVASSTSSSARTITIDWIDVSESTTIAYKLCNEHSLSSKSFKIFYFKNTLEENDILRATVSSTEIMDITLSLEESYINR